MKGRANYTVDKRGNVLLLPEPKRNAYVNIAEVNTSEDGKLKRC